MSSFKGVDAESTGRDNDPRGLGDMPDSQGPSMVQSQLRDSVSGPHMSPPGVFPEMEVAPLHNGFFELSNYWVSQ